MRSFAALTPVAAIALAACARSEPAETDFNQSMLEAPAAVVNDSVPDVAPAPSTDLPVAASLRQALATSGGLSEEARWLTARADLNGDGKDEVLAYVLDPKACKAEGCALYVLSDNGTNGFQLTDTIAPVQLPVYVLAPAGADGWATLGVTVGAEGSQRALMSVPHNANGYAKNPAADPAKPAQAGAAKPLLDDPANAQPLPKP